MAEKAKMNPGSREAHDAGCTCPILDNNHGRIAPIPPDGWYINVGCPLHDKMTDDSGE